MANSVGELNKRVDTFGADVTLESDVVTVSGIVIVGYTSGKTVTLIDTDGNIVLVLECASGASKEWSPAVPVTFPNGLVFDESASDLAAGDFLFVFTVQGRRQA